MQIAREGVLAEPRGNCLLDLGAETWQGDRAYVRRDLKGEMGQCQGLAARGPLLPLPQSLAWDSCLPARTGAGGGGGAAGGGESLRFWFSSLGAAPRRPGQERGSEEHCWPGAVGDLGLVTQLLPKWPWAPEFHPWCLASWVNWARLSPKCLAGSRGDIRLLALVCRVNRGSQITCPAEDLVQVRSCLCHPLCLLRGRPDAWRWTAP